MGFISKYKVFYLILILVLSSWAVKPLLRPGYFPMHDDTQPSRVQQMAKALSEGQFPVRWVSDLGYGYGYPLFNFYAPLPYYVGTAFNLLGFEIITATKLMFMVGILLSAYTMFLLISGFAGNYAGLTGSMLYLYAPYHAVNIYVRGAVGEYYAYAFLPLLLIGVFKRNILIGSLGLAAVLLSHNILGMITVYFFMAILLALIIYKFIKQKSLTPVYYLLFTFLLGIGLSAFFTLPAILEKQYTGVEELTKEGSNFQNHFVYIDQLWQSDWGYAGSAQGRADGMSFKIGKLHLVLSLISFIYLIFLYKKRKMTSSNLNIYLAFILLFIVSVFLMLSISEQFWKLIPGFPYIQYPWRFINFTLLTIAFIQSAIFIKIRSRIGQIIAILIIIATLFLNIKYFRPQAYLSVNADSYVSPNNLKYKISKISDEYLPEKFEIPENENNIPNQVLPEIQGMRTKVLGEHNIEKTYLLEVPEKTNIILNMAYFPGWNVYVDGNEEKINNSDGKIEFNISGGSPHIISIRFSDTYVRKIGNTISLLTVFLLVYVTLFRGHIKLWKRRKRL